MRILVINLGLLCFCFLNNAYATSDEWTQGEFKHEVRQFQKPYDNQQAEQISLMV